MYSRYNNCVINGVSIDSIWLESAENKFNWQSLAANMNPQIDLLRYQTTSWVLNGVASEFLSERFVLADHWQPPRYYFNVNVLAIVTKINNNAYVTSM